MTLGEVRGSSARAPGVVVSRRIDDKDVGVTVTYEIRAMAEGRALVTDRLEGVEPREFGFHPDNEPPEWAMEDETVVFEVPLVPGETDRIVFGLRTDETDDLLVREPTVERIDEEGDGDRSTTVGLLGHLSSLASLGGGQTAPDDAGENDDDGGTIADEDDDTSDAVAVTSGDSSRTSSTETGEPSAATSPDAPEEASLADRLDAIDDRVASIEERDLDERLSDIERRLDELTGALAFAGEGDEEPMPVADEGEGPWTIGSNDVGDLSPAERGSIVGRLDTLASSQADLQDRLGTVDGRLGDLSSSQDHLDERLAVLDETLDDVTTTQERLADRLDAQENRVADLTGERGQFDESLETMSKRLDAVGTNQERLDERLGATEDNVRELANAYERVDQRLDTISGNIEGLDELRSALTGLMDANDD